MPRKKKNLNKKIPLPEGISASLEGSTLVLDGKKGQVRRKFQIPGITLKIEDNNILVNVKKTNKKTKIIVGTTVAHIKNMFKGAKEGHIYKLKIVSSHFPMSVDVKNNEFTVKNLFGEKIPRILKLKEGADIKIEGDIINIESKDKEIAGQIAGDIEKLCRISKRDRRIFQDGIYIVEKDGKQI